MSTEKLESTSIEDEIVNQETRIREIVPSTDYIELTIEDVAIDTVIDMRAYFQENGLSPSKSIQSYDLFRWISKQIKRK